MAEDFVKREEYNRGQERIHSRVDEISKSTIEIKECSKSIKDDVKSMTTLLYGNGKNGLITKIATMCSKVNHQWWVIGIILIMFGWFIKISLTK